LYLVFTWIITFMSCTREIAQFEPLEFVTQAFITMHAVLCTALMLGSAPETVHPEAAVELPTLVPASLRKVVVLGLLTAVLSSLAGCTLKRMLFGDKVGGVKARGGFYMDHIRFGPNNTNNTK